MSRDIGNYLGNPVDVIVIARMSWARLLTSIETAVCTVPSSELQDEDAAVLRSMALIIEGRIAKREVDKIEAR